MNTIPEISQALEKLFSESSVQINKIGEEVAHLKAIAEKWTISEELAHIILSAKPITKVLEAGAAQFINPDLEPRKGLTYEALEAKYQSALGLVTTSAPARYAKDPADESTFREQSKGWLEIGKRLRTALSKWSEEDVDLVQLKHPLLGLLTLREMLFFTHMHTKHHLQSIQNKALVARQF